MLETVAGWLILPMFIVVLLLWSHTWNAMMRERQEKERQRREQERSEQDKIEKKFSDRNPPTDQIRPPDERS